MKTQTVCRIATIQQLATVVRGGDGTPSTSDPKFTEFIAHGGRGVEVVTGSHSAQEATTKKLKANASLYKYLDSALGAFMQNNGKELSKYLELAGLENNLLQKTITNSEHYKEKRSSDFTAAPADAVEEIVRGQTKSLAEYEDKMARAKEMYFFFNTQRSLLPVLKKATNPIRVENCEDRDETVLRLAFLSVDQGYNSVIEAEVVSAKVRNGGHHKHFWKGTAFPANLDLERFERSTLGR